MADRVEISRHIVADPEICHSKPTFKGTRIMAWQVLEDLQVGRSWDFICNVRWAGRIPLTAVGEAVELAEAALQIQTARRFSGDSTSKTAKKPWRSTHEGNLAHPQRSARRSAGKRHQLAAA